MARDRARIALDRDVEVEHRAAEQAVANGAADDPGALAAQRLAGDVERVAQGLPPVYARITRGVSAHVTS
jgi:hypothetical protein